MNETGRTVYHGKSLLQWLHPNARFLRWCLGVFLILMAAGWLVLQCYIYFCYEPYLIQSVGSKTYYQMKALWNETLDLPEEYFTGVPISQELKAAYDSVTQARRMLQQNRNSSNGSDRVDKLLAFWRQRSYNSYRNNAIVSSQLSAIDPLFEAGFLLADRIERDVAPLSPGGLLPLYDRASWSREELVSLFLLKAGFLISEKKFNGAFHYYTTAFPLLLECPYQNFDRFVQGDRLSELSKKMASLVPRISSIPTLRAELNRLNRLEPHLFPCELDRCDRLETISLIRDFKQRYWRQFDATPGKKAGEYIHQIAILKNPHMNFFHSISCIPQWVMSSRKPKKEEIAGMLRPFSLSNAPNDFFYFQIYCLREYSKVRSCLYDAATDFDVLRLKIAARIYRFDAGKNVAAITDLVPNYFSKEIKDRQSGAPYKWTEDNDLLRDQKP